MRLSKYIFLLTMLAVLLSSPSFAEVKNEKKIGLLLGDPIAISLQVPVKEKNYLNIRAGIWSWSFWHDLKYDTPYLSFDYVWLLSSKQSKYTYSVGTGIALFFADNPKDENDYNAAAAVRFPLGIEFYSNDNMSMGFELAPIYQFLPAYNAKPYIIELNGGLVLRFSYY